VGLERQGSREISGHGDKAKEKKEYSNQKVIIMIKKELKKENHSRKESNEEREN